MMAKRPDAEEARRAQAYFEAIENAFIRLRGAPFLLSPPDWHLVRSWYEQGIPRATVEEALEDVFRRRRDRGKDDKKVWGLRQCKKAVETAWLLQQDLEASVKSAVDETAGGFEERLAVLADALPDALKDRASWKDRILALRGQPEEIENALAEIDRELLDSAESALDAGQAERLESALQRSLDTLATRLPAVEVERARDRLRQQLLREMADLPLLSLFG